MSPHVTILNAWLGHQLPHIVVLHDIDSRSSYWAHITSESVRFTRAGAKILVPVTNRVDEENADKLLAVAASNASQASWEGTAWAGVSLSPTHQLRHALLVPRLVAPHPNLSLDGPPTAAQAIAMLTQIRLLELTQLSEQHEQMPSLAAPPADAPWEWKFASGIWNFIHTGDPDVLRTWVEESQPAHCWAAAAVVYASALLEDGRADEAAGTLSGILASNKLDVVDHAWVQLQHARSLSELGRRQEARDAALSLIGLRLKAPKDVTAAAIAGAAADLVFAVSDWENQDIPTTISASDTTAMWWQQQVLSYGLSAQAEKSFKRWGNDESITIGDTDSAWRYLRSASLLSGFLGDHRAWRQTTKQLASYKLGASTKDSEIDMVASSLTVLRQSGDHKGLKLAVARMVANGPAIAARDAVLDVRPDRSTATSAHADLVMLEKASDLLPEERAAETAEWACTVFLNPAAYIARTQPTFYFLPDLIDVMSGLVYALDDTAREKLADFLLSLPPQTDESVTGNLAVLARRLPAAVWTEERAQRAADRAPEDHSTLGFPLLEIAAARVPGARQRIEDEIRNNSLDALAAFGDVRNLGEDLVQALIAHSTDRLEQIITEAQQGQVGISSYDYGHTVALLSVWHPAHANWDIIYRLLTSIRLGRLVNRTLDVLGRKAPDLPDEVATRLLPLAQRIADGPPPTAYLFLNPDPRPAARQLLSRLQARSGNLDYMHLLSLARGDAAARRAATLLARLAAEDQSTAVLIGLSNDHDPQVRAGAARGIAEAVARGNQLAAAQLPLLTTDPGTLVPRALAAATSDNPELAKLEPLILLRTHMSGHVRHLLKASHGLLKRPD